jgi:hypothetical protein
MIKSTVNRICFALSPLVILYRKHGTMPTIKQHPELLVSPVKCETRLTWLTGTAAGSRATSTRTLGAEVNQSERQRGMLILSSSQLHISRHAQGVQRDQLRSIRQDIFKEYVSSFVRSTRPRLTREGRRWRSVHRRDVVLYLACGRRRSG